MSNKKFLFAVFFAIASAAFPQAAPGTIAGSVYDGQTGRPILGVLVSVDGVVDAKNVTSADGRFAIPAPAGKHALKFTADTYQPVDIREVTVQSGEVVEASTLMTNERLVTSIDVVEKLDAVSSTSEAMLVERKLSAVVSDSIGHQELAEGTAGDAAGALEKVTGVSVVGDGFVYVRGLGERYSATSLNGSMVPTTEPEKRVVPLDLFPTGMIESIQVAKTYKPDLPAEFSGGLVQLQTTEFPPRTLFTVSAKGGFNSLTSFNPFLSYPGSGSDFWGFGSGARGIPSLIGDQRLLGGSFTRAQFQEFGRSFDNNWEPTTTSSMRPALDWSVNGGSTIGKFGLTGALSFSNKPQTRSEINRYIRQGSDGPFVFTNYEDYREDSESARMGGVFNVSYRFNPGSKIVFRNTYTHDSDKTARNFSGYDGTSDAIISGQRLRYIERQLFATGVDGEHSLGWHNSLIHWQFNVSSAKRDEPDLREVLRSVLPDGRQSFASFGNSGLRFFSKLDEKIYDPQFDYSVPFFKGSVTGLFKMGVRASIRRRDFQARRFRFIPQDSTAINSFLPSNQLFIPENIRPNALEIVEFTRGTDKYDGQMDIYAGYAMVDLSIGPKLRLVGGIRIEDADIFVQTADPQIPNTAPAIARLKNRDPAPSINLIYSLTQKQNLRVSYSRTLSRPDFRELSPFDFVNVQGGFVTTGFPDLKRTAIQNFDVRWELFPGGNQLVAASFFVKKFTNPIEQIVLAANDLRQSFRNAKGARNAGVELEFRQGLGSFNSSLKEFSLSSNFTLVNSNIDLDPSIAGVLTSKSRAMVGQSKYVFNGTIGWARPRWHSDARFLANYVSSKITDLGTFGVPDIYQQPVTSLDFSYQYTRGERGQWQYRFEAENLNNNNFLWSQGAFTQRQYRLGRTYQIGLSYSFF